MNSTSAGIMSIYGLSTEHALEGTLNFCAWKDKMEVLLDDNGVLECIKNDIPKPPASDAQQLTQWRKDSTKARRMILDGFRDHIVPNLHWKETTFQMWKVRTDLFKSNSDARKLALKNKLRSI